MNWINFFIILFLNFSTINLCWSNLTPDEEKKYDEVDGLKFLEVLLKDQKYNEAIDQFKKYSPQKKDATTFHLLIGQAYFSLSRYNEAKNELEKITQDFSHEYFLLRGKIAYELKTNQDCIDALKKVMPEGIEYYLECLSRTQHNDEIYKTLSLLDNKNDAHQVLKVKYLIDLRLINEAQIAVSEQINQCPTTSYFFKVQELLEKKNIKLSNFWETAHYCHPESLEINSEHIKSLFVNDQKISLQNQFQTMAFIDPQYFQHSNEFFKHAGINEANYLHHLLNPDDKSYYEFKLQNYIEKENYVMATTLASKISSNDYALAYSYFMTNNFNNADKILKTKVKRNSEETKLLTILQDCQKLNWRCRP